MGNRRNSETLFVVVDYVGDRFIEHGPEATVGDLVAALRGSKTPTAGSIQVQRTGQLLSPSARLSLADIRSGDRLRFVQADRIASLAEGDLSRMGSATMQMLSGPLAGSLFGIDAGSSTIGRVSSNDVVIVDPGISRHHAVLTVDDSTVTLVDNKSTNGIRIDGELLSGPTEIESGRQLLLGQSWVSIVHHPPFDPVSAADDLLVEWSDRPVHRYAGETIVLPEPPTAAPKRRRGEFLGAGRTGQRVARDEFTASLEPVGQRLEAIEKYELASRLYEAPSIQELLFGATTNWRLWERRVADVDGLEFRLGLAPMASRTTIEIPPGGDTDYIEQLTAIQERHRRIDGVPAVIDFRKLGSVGLGGQIDSMHGLAYSIVAQLAWFNGPDQLGVACRPGETAEVWDWLKWLPHVDFSGSHNGVADGDFVGWVSSLLDGAPPTVAGTETGVDDRRVSRPDAILIVVEHEKSLPGALLARLLQEGPERGLYTLLLGGDLADHDAPVGAKIAVGSRMATIEGEADLEVGEIALEVVELEAVAGLARRLTAIRCSSSSDEAKLGITDEIDDSGVIVGPFQLGLAQPLEAAAVTATTIPVKPRQALKPVPQRDLKTLPHGNDDARLVLGTVRTAGRPQAAVFAYNLSRDGSLGLTGDRGAGKTSALRSVAAAAAMLRVEPTRLPMIYYLDVRGDLAAIGGLPHSVGAARNDIDGFRSVVTDLERLLVDRAASLSQADVATFDEYRRLAPQSSLRRAVVLIDEVDAFVELMDSLEPGRAGVLLDQLAEFGGRLGVHLVFSVGRQDALAPSLIGRVGRWLELGGIRQGEPLSPGLAIVGPNEVQFATVGGGRAQHRALIELADQLVQRGVAPAAP